MPVEESLLRQIADDFRAAAEGKMDEAKLDAAVETILASDTSYPANGEIVSGVFWVEVRVDSWDGQSDQFTGEGGGVFTPGGGALFGDVYTDDLDTLLADTDRFEVNAAAAYTSVVFFDSDSNCLGHYESGSVSTVVGIGGGSGSWA